MSSSLLNTDYLSEEDSLLDNFLDFDFSDELLSLDSLLMDTSSETEQPPVKTENENLELHKPLVKKRGSRFMKKSSSQTKPVSKHVETSTGMRFLKPNMSRRTRDPMLYAFPSFDRCDSLLFFAHSLARHLNSGDIPSVAKLFASHISTDCHIHSVKASCRGNHRIACPTVDAPTLVRMYAMHNEIFPDRITCVRSVQVDGNQIKALSYIKFTNSPAIIGSFAETTKEPLFVTFFGKDWKTTQRQKIEDDERPEQQKEEIFRLIEAGKDMVVHSRMEYTLTIDDRTRKIIAWKAVMNTMSIAAAGNEELVSGVGMF
eukprot:CAMPEP_0185013112 /NCGR_PEP_ID=MMETSP1098-20130426/98641_1 /TAXON_ID=89044 /ORGANISM="Spumella elongata, Strain CCAP 955/1" /LENGTH=315 /DNA_ID=CAMNT_0027542177 /DNA_START=51 /DNA_END=998 /DNA_ORIENTATION=-